MFFLRLTLYTLAFYLAIALPIIAVELVVGYWKGMFGLYFQGRGGIAVFAIFWGAVWLLSFILAFRIVFRSVWEKFV